MAASRVRDPVRPAPAPGSPAVPTSAVEALVAELVGVPRCHRPARPSITATYAQSLDGSIAAHPGAPLRLSGSAALELTHRLRSQHDAILVGIGTVLADDPQLNVRLAAGRSPDPIILDSRLRLPLTSRLLEGVPGARSLVVATTTGAPPEAAARLRERGAAILEFPADAAGRVPLPPLMRLLWRRGVRRLLVEGGGRVLTSLFADRLADCAVITVAPRLVGGEPALARVESAVALRRWKWERFEDDLVLAGAPDFRRR